MSRLAAALCALLLTACAAGPGPRDDSLYRDLGGEEGISAIVEGLLFRLVENPRIVHHFAETDIIQLHARLVEQFCVEAGGPCEYQGLDMQAAHSGMALDEADFNALVEDLIEAMEALDVPTTAQNRLLRRLAPMRPEIIHQ